MSWVSAFSSGELAVSVTYQGSPLFSGSVGLNGSVNFDDANSDFTCTLAVDANGVVSLTSTANPENWTGGKYSVSLAVPVIANLSGIQLIQCASDPDIFGGTQLSSLSDGASTNFEGSTFVYSALPASTFGMSAVPGGA